MILMSSVHSASSGFVGRTTCFRIILIYLVHFSSFSLVRFKTNSLHLESLNKSTFQKLPGTGEVASFMRISISAVHSGRFRLVQRKTSFLRHEWHERLYPSKSARENSYLLFCDDFLSFVRTFCKFESSTSPIQYSPLWVTRDLNFLESAGDNSYLLFYDIFYVLSTFSCRVRRKVTFLRYKWHENSTLRKVAGTTQTSWFTMHFMSFVHSASLSLVRRPTSILRYEWRETQLCRKWRAQLIPPNLRKFWCRDYILQLQFFYDGEQSFFIMGHSITRFLRGF